MRAHVLFNKIGLYWSRVLSTAVKKRSVSNATVRRRVCPLAVGGSLKRWRDFSGDPNGVRSVSGLVPAEAALRRVAVVARLLRAAVVLFFDARGFTPVWVKQGLAQRGQGGVEGVSLVQSSHPAVHLDWNAAALWETKHIAQTRTPKQPQALRGLDAHFDSLGLQRSLTARRPDGRWIFARVASSLHVLPTWRRYSGRLIDHLPVPVLPCPARFPRMTYDPLWQPRTCNATAGKGLRERVKSVAAPLKNKERQAFA